MAVGWVGCFLHALFCVWVAGLYAVAVLILLFVGLVVRGLCGLYCLVRFCLGAGFRFWGVINGLVFDVGLG